MAQRPVVPQFGNWDPNDNVPYTVYFEKARKGKTGGKIINPNDPMENPDMFPPSAQANSSRARTALEEPVGWRAVQPTSHDSRSSREDSDPRKFTEAPLRNDNVNRRNATGSPHENRDGSGSGSARTGRQSAGSDYSIGRSPLHPQYQAKMIGKGSGSEHSIDRSPLHPQYQAKMIGKGSGSEHSIDRSPLHPQYQAKMIGKGSASPAWEGKYSNDSSHGTPGRSRMKPVSREVESPDRGAAVPRFGDWDEKNPSSADNYTHIFNKVRQEKNSTSPVVSNMGIEQANADRRKQSYQDKYKSQSSCFPCCRK